MSTTSTITKPPVPLLIKTRQVATILSVSMATVRNLLDSGDLVGKEINPATRKKRRKHLRITRKSLETFYKDRFGHSLDRALAHSFEP